MPIQAVIFDWAGTTIDYGCFSPLSPFISAFKEHGIIITMEEARGPMGKLKIDHVRDLICLPSVTEQFFNLYQRKANEQDIVAIYNDFEKQVLARLPEFVVPIPNVVNTVSELRNMGLKVGSTTGYTSEMMKIVLPLAREQGYSPDCCITSTDVKRGRPYPYMIYKNMLELDIPSVSSIIKVGDTISDIQEGVNAGCISVGIIEGSSELGLSLEEFVRIDAEDKYSIMNKVRYRMYGAGANYVLNNISELPELINWINKLKEL